MAYTYDRSPSGDILHVSRCHDGHLTLIVVDKDSHSARPVCIAAADVAEVLGEMQAWAAGDSPTAMPHPRGSAAPATDDPFIRLLKDAAHERGLDIPFGDTAAQEKWLRDRGWPTPRER